MFKSVYSMMPIIQNHKYINVRLGIKMLTQPIDYLNLVIITAVKSFIEPTLGACTIKHFRIIIYRKWTYFVVS